MGTKAQKLGDLAEQFAEKVLLEQGYTPIAHHYQCYGGELDWVAKDGELLIFLEVRCRKEGGVHPVNTLTLKKQKSLIQAAFSYLGEHGLEDTSYRFDLLWITHQPVGDTYGFSYDYLENVFGIHEGNYPSLIF